MTLGNKKYLAGALFLSLVVVAGVVVSCSPVGRSATSQNRRIPIFDRSETVSREVPAEEVVRVADTVIQIQTVDTLASLHADVAPSVLHIVDSLTDIPVPVADTAVLASWPDPASDSLPGLLDTLAGRYAERDTIATIASVVRRQRDKPFLDAPVKGKAQDSLIYDVSARLIHHYNQGELVYQDNDLKADYIVVNAGNKDIFGTGVVDTAGVRSRPEFIQGGANYTMDTVTYNLDSRKALIKGVATKDGEGNLLGRRTKMMSDKTVNIEGAKYSTCDLEHPHFYIAMTKARMIPGKKIITGPAYFVMEDVPIYFLGIPGGFFPMSTGPTAGLIMPTWGEEGNRGFYLRRGGYYFTFGDHFDLELTGDIYTLGSWALQARSRYIKRYKFSGQFSLEYQKFIMGEKTSADYRNSNTFKVTWNHTQDPKATPRQTFSANINFSTAGQKQLATTSLQDHLNTNTSSAIQYSRNWDVGSTNVALTASFNMNTSSRDSTISVTLPNVSLSVGSFAPFKRKMTSGKQLWYEKITMDYSMQAQNSTGTVKERDFFTKKTLRDMSNGIQHRISVKTSLNLLNYINFSPSLNYQESWNFKRQIKVWDPTMGQNGAQVPVDDLPTEFGFYRTYGWSINGSLSTKLYGVFEVKRKPGKTGWLQAIRHMITPTVGFSYAPDFTHPRYGFYEHVQRNANGDVEEYIPIMGNPRVTPGGASASVTASLSNQLEIKVKDRRDSTGMKKITIIEQLSLSGISWNFLKDSMNLSNVSISLRTGEIWKGFALQLSGNWTPYQYVQVANGVKQINKFAIGKGKFGRITSTSWSFGKTFNSPNSKTPDPGSINGRFVNPYDPWDYSNNLDPTARRQAMVGEYYDFSVPWSLTFNYSVNYNYTGLRPVITQNLGFNGNVTLTEKWGFHFESGYDFTRRKLSHMQLGLNRDLHCWSMSFQWVPFGMTKMYSFHIGINSSMLADIKYDKSSNAYDNLVR